MLRNQKTKINFFLQGNVDPFVCQSLDSETTLTSFVFCKEYICDQSICKFTPINGKKMALKKQKKNAGG